MKGVTSEVRMDPASGMAKVTVRGECDSRTVWLGVGRRYRVSPLHTSPGAVARSDGRSGTLVELLQDDSDSVVRPRVRWDDTGRVGRADPRVLVEIVERTGVIQARGQKKSALGHSRILDRSDDRHLDRVADAVSTLASVDRTEEKLHAIGQRATRRPLCELCRRVHTRSVYLRACQFCWEKAGYPTKEVMDERLNALAYDRHVKGLP